VANDKVIIWSQIPRLGRYPASGELLLGNGAGFTLSSLSTTLDTISSTQGSILYRGASSWTALAPGTSGQFLQTNGASANPAWASVGGIPSFTQTEFVSGLIPVPTNQAYNIIINIPYGATITTTTTIATSGTCTATFAINGTAIGGTANSVSSSQNVQTHASSNVASSGATISMTVSSNSTCLGLAFTIAFTRTLS
jgi:hypothetical protein